MQINKAKHTVRGVHIIMSTTQQHWRAQGGTWGGVRPPNPVSELRRINTNAVNLVT